MISLGTLKILTPLQKLPKNVKDFGKFIVAKALKSCPKFDKSPNLVTLHLGLDACCSSLEYKQTPDQRPLYTRTGFHYIIPHF